MNLLDHILNNADNYYENLHRIIDGSMDGDRLDYVARDPLNAGMDVGKIEYNRIISMMKLIYRDDKFLFLP